MGRGEGLMGKGNCRLERRGVDREGELLMGRGEGLMGKGNCRLEGERG